MIGLLVFFLVIVVVMLAVGGRLTSTMTRRQRERVDDVRASDRHPRRTVLHYRVPEGQDPAVVTLGLDRAGYEAVEDPQGAEPLEVLIAGRGGAEPDREEVRTVLTRISQVNIDRPVGGHVDRDTTRGPIRFTDEVGER